MWPTVAQGHTRVVQPWCDKIAKESNNRMRCQVLPAVSGGGTPAQMFDRMKDGVDDLVITLPGYTAGRFPVMEAFELPFMTFNAESASRAAWDYYGKYATKEFTNTKMIATWVRDPGFLSTSYKRIRTLEDFKGLKVRAASRQSSRLLAKLGATPVGMPIPAVADAMSKGTIDGYLTAWEIIPSFKLLYYSDRVENPEMTLKVTGYQWYWGYEYPDHGGINFLSYMVPDADIKTEEGQKRLLSTDNVVVLPVDTTIQILVTAGDVLHAFALPALGVKIDAVPGRMNETWVRITKPGVYYGQCSELCGKDHSYMPMEIRAVPKEEFEAWVEKAKEEFS
jgi:cytochrome c oxidase subunit II